MNTRILVATHKNYQMPEDSLYLPLHVGAHGKNDIGFTRDDSGDNISTKNPYYCELTGLYWAWKNIDFDYLGLCHYRRFFTLSRKIPKEQSEKYKIILSETELNKLLTESPIILPKKRNYIIETVYNHYKHTMYIEPLDETGRIIAEKYPEYSKAFENLKHKRRFHAFNMFIMEKKFVDGYCTWLFDILGELEKRIDSSKYTDFHKRFYGRVAERMLDVWLETNNYKYKEIKVINIENINWFNKIKSFLSAKFMGKRYEKSF